MDAKDFRSALILAAKEGQIEIVEKLYNAYSKLASKEEFYFGLYFAAFSGKEDIVQFFISKGINPNFVVGVYLTPLHAAVLNGHENIVKILLDHGAEVDPKIKVTSGKKIIEADYFCSPLLGATCKNHEGIVNLLLERGADVNVRLHSKDDKLEDALEKELTYGTFSSYQLTSSRHNFTGYTPLHFVIFYKKENLAKLLLERGADINARCDSDLTPLCIACHRNDTSLIKFLLQEGADMQSEVAKGKTLLHYILFDAFEATLGECYNWYNKSDEIERNKSFRLMLKLGADPNRLSKNSKATVLHYAASCGMANAVHLLLKFGANVNAVDDKKKTPLQNTIIHLKKILAEVQRGIRNRKSYNLTHTKYEFNIYDYQHVLEHDEGFSVLNDPDPFRMISQLLVRELVRLEATGKTNVKQNVTQLETRFVKPYHTRCKNELKKLKKTPIAEGVNHYDFLLANDSKLSGYMENKKIIDALNKEEWKRLFPNYSRFLQININRGLKRKHEDEDDDEEESDGYSDDEEVKKSVQKKGQFKRRRENFRGDCVIS